MVGRGKIRLAQLPKSDLPIMSKIPAAGLRARKVLEEKGLEITAENLTKHLDAKELNKLGNAMRHALKGDE